MSSLDYLRGVREIKDIKHKASLYHTKKEKSPREIYLIAQRKRLYVTIHYYKQRGVLNQYVETMRMFVDCINKELRTIRKND
jgi:hypothetical protein